MKYFLHFAFLSLSRAAFDENENIGTVYYIIFIHKSREIINREKDRSANEDYDILSDPTKSCQC